MNKTLKSILIGIALGSLPLWGSTFLYYVTPLVVTENPGSLLSFAVFLFYILSVIAVLIISIILIIKEKSLIGKTAIPFLLLQFIVVYFIFDNIQ